MRRRTWLALVLWGLCGSLGLAASDPIAPGGPTLQETLEKGLRLRRPVEFQFVAKVIEKVDNGDLPKQVVVTTYLWARNKRPFPYPYFEKALRTQATKLGVTL